MLQLRLAGRCIRQTRFLNTSCVRHAITVKMPSLSPTMTSGKIVQWLKQEGDTLEPGDAICEIQTDKAVVTMEVDEDGVLAKLLATADAELDVGRPIALIAEEGEDVEEVRRSAAVDQEGTSSSSQTSAEPAPSPTSTSAPTTATTGHSVIGPATRLLLQQFNLTAADVTTRTGPYGILTKHDVNVHISTKGLKPATQKTAKKSTKKPSKTPATASSAQSYTDVPISDDRRRTALNDVANNASMPHAYVTTTIPATNVSAEDLQRKLEEAAAVLSQLFLPARAGKGCRIEDLSMYRAKEATTVLQADENWAVTMGASKQSGDRCISITLTYNAAALLELEAIKITDGLRRLCSDDSSHFVSALD